MSSRLPPLARSQVFDEGRKDFMTGLRERKQALQDDFDAQLLEFRKKHPEMYVRTLADKLECDYFTVYRAARRLGVATRRVVA